MRNFCLVSGGAAGHHEGQDVAQGLGAERLEAFRHQRPARVLAIGDLVLLNDDVAVDVPEGDSRRVLAGDDAGECLALLRRDVPLPVARIDLAVGIDDVREERRAAVRAHAVERWADLRLSDCAELVARRAGSGEERLALLGIARLFDVRSERRDDVGLRPCPPG